MEEENKDINDALDYIKYHETRIKFYKIMIIEEELAIERLQNLVVELMKA